MATYYRKVVHLKYKITCVILAILAAFAFGRYTVKPTIVKDTEVTTDTKKEKDTHKETTVVVVEAPNGEKKTVTTVVEDTTTNTHQTKDSETHEVSTPPKVNTLNLSALAGLDMDYKPVYGISITKNVLGPITVGVFGLTNRTIGVSAGLSF